MEPAIIDYVTYNGKQIAPRHYTDTYQILTTTNNSAVLRRGFDFYLTARLDRDFNAEKDVIRVEFKFGPKPKKDRTKITLILRPKQGLPQDPYQWGTALDRVDPNYVMMLIHIPANAPVGAWSCSVRTNIRGSPKNYRNYQVPNDIYILFNPWCKEDDVYMPNEDERKEYILNETGKIALGTWWKPVGRHWIFSQFDDISLRTAIFLLDKTNLAPEERGNVVRVARAISAIINADDDNGLLKANWDGNYSDGTDPSAWTGSKPILDQYYNSGGAPVRYGICWVFSAATVTVCRALGIPCRSTTVYVSAEGSDSLTRQYDAFGNIIEDTAEYESLWNYHVWNDVWMARPLMPEMFGGWQVIDGTPQRHSEGLMRCGPASLEAVRRQFTDYLYDTDFVYAKLNADVRHFVIDDESDLGDYLIPKNNYQAGKKIVTKALGGDDLLDITSQYKGQTQTKSRPSEISDVPSDVVFEIVKGEVPLGDTLILSVKIYNKSDYTRSIWTVLGVSSVLYTGKLVDIIDRKDDNVTVAPGQTILVSLGIPASKYIPKLVDQGYIRLYAFGEVKETKQRWAEEEGFKFTQPSLTINTGRYYKIGDPIEVNVSFRNPLNITLTNCTYMIDGPTDDIPRIVNYRDVPPLEEVRYSGILKVGQRTGKRTIVATFTSKQLQVADKVFVVIEPWNGNA